MISKTACLLHMTATLVVYALAPSTWAQASPPSFDPAVLTFEVVSVHPDSPDGMGGMARVEWRDTGYEASHITVRDLVCQAYGVDNIQIQNEPSWMDSEPFTIEARLDENAIDSMKRLDEAGLRLGREHLLQVVLAERFKLALMPSRKQLPIYELSLASAAPRLRRAMAGAQYTDGERWGDGALMGAHVVSYLFMGGQVQMKGQGASIEQLIERLNQKLSTQLGRTFVNATNLSGDFDFDLSFTVPWRTALGPMESSITAGDVSDNPLGPSLFSAFREQLGLKLTSTKGPVRTLWIEHVDQPTEN